MLRNLCVWFLILRIVQKSLVQVILTLCLDLHHCNLSHMIANDLSDDIDLQREVRNIFVRTNILVRRFSRCSPAVKAVLFKAYCISLYDAALWKFYKAGSMRKLVSCYNKCVKIFFGYQRMYSMTHFI